MLHKQYQTLILELLVRPVNLKTDQYFYKSWGLEVLK